MKRFISLFLCCLILLISLSSFAFAGDGYTEFLPTVYGSVSPTSSYVSLLYGYLVNYRGEVPKYWIIVRTAEQEYTVFWSNYGSVNQMERFEALVYHSSYNYNGPLFDYIDYRRNSFEFKHLPRNFSYVGNVNNSCAFTSDFSSSQYDYSFIVLCVIAVLFIFLLFRRGYPGKVRF